MYRHIRFFNSSATAGGVGRVISCWGEYFAGLGYSVEVIVASNRQNGFPESALLEYKYWGRERHFLNVLANLFVEIRGCKDSVLIFNKGFYILPLFILRLGLSLKQRNTKFVYFVHGGSSSLRFFYSKPKVWLLSLVFDHVICLTNDFNKVEVSPSRALRRILLDTLFPFSNKSLFQKLVIIPNPAPFSAGEDDQEPSVKENIMLCVGRFDFIKGQDLAIDAWILIEEFLPSWELHFAGEGRELEPVKKQANRLGCRRVKFLGFESNIQDLYRTAKILVLPSRVEGFGMVTYEAFAFGVPVVSFETVGSKLTISNGDDGFVAPQYDVQVFSDFMLELALNNFLREGMARNARSKVKKMQARFLARHWDRIMHKNES